MNTSSTLLPNWLARCAENFPDQLAIHCGPLRWSFVKLDQQATHLAQQLASTGIRPGDRVAALTASGLAYVVCVHALTRLDAILVPLNTRLTQDELIWQIKDVQATFFISDSPHTTLASTIAEHIPTLRHIQVSIDATHTTVINRLYEASNAEKRKARETIEVPLQGLINLDATQVIMYTSGTTGKPKGVIITYGMQWWNAIGSALNLGHHTDDCWLACMPLFHIGGLSILMRSVINGISVVLHEKFDPLAVNQAIYEERVTIISVVAVMLQRMLSALDASEQIKTFPGTLRCVLLGGGPAPRPLLEDCARRTIPVVQTYGLTESCSQAVTLAPVDALRKSGSAGRPLLTVQLCVLHNEQPVPAGEPGIIYLKGPSITTGYADRPEATSQVLRDGWLSTGDLGYLDAEGYLYVLDRRNDLIISGGENVYPAEIEATLLAHPAVEEAGVCGQTDTHWGQVPIAFVCLRHGHTTSTKKLLTYASEHLAHYKLPRAIYIVEQLPHNSAGKLLRRELPQLLLEHPEQTD